MTKEKNYLLFIVYSNAVDEEIVEIMQKHASGYTKFNGVQGEGGSEPHLGTHIWPSINNCIMTSVSGDRAKLISSEITTLKEKFQGIGVTIFPVKIEPV